MPAPSRAAKSFMPSSTRSFDSISSADVDSSSSTTDGPDAREKARMFSR